MSKLILLRHGQSTWNLSNRFTGWVDVPLSELGFKEAQDAGYLMRDAELAPRMVHTSLLKRAIVTANLALDAMDLDWLPVRRSWRLNERHYGGLQGLNKAETQEKYGEAQVLTWRRSYSTPPPPLDDAGRGQFRADPRYDGIDPPATEALSNVVERMLPYWESDIIPDLDAGLDVLVVAHGNSLRALVKHLNGLSEDAIVALNIPTGVPLVYELGMDHMPVEEKPVESRYIGDPAAIAAKAEAVARQASGSAPGA